MKIFFASKIRHYCSFISRECGSLSTQYDGGTRDGKVGQIANQPKAARHVREALQPAVDSQCLAWILVCLLRIEQVDVVPRAFV